MPPLTEWVGWPAVTVFATPAFALLGGWWGAQLALNRYKSERTFERRLEWHLQALRDIQSLDRATGAVGYGPEPRPAEYHDARARVRCVVDESRAFMTATDHRQLLLAHVQLWQPVRDTDEARERGEEPEVLSQFFSQERGFIDDMEAALLQGLGRLMPQEHGVTFGARVRGLLPRRAKRQRHSKG